MKFNEHLKYACLHAWDFASIVHYLLLLTVVIVDYPSYLSLNVIYF